MGMIPQISQLRLAVWSSGPKGNKTLPLLWLRAVPPVLSFAPQTWLYFVRKRMHTPFFPHVPIKSAFGTFCSDDINVSLRIFRQVA